MAEEIKRRVSDDRNRAAKRAVIVFTDEWLPYSSTVLNLLLCLEEKGYRARIVTVRSGLFRNFERFQNEVDSFWIPLLLQKLLAKIRIYRLSKFVLFTIFHGHRIRQTDLCFSVDSLGFLASRLFQKHPYYVSLEVQRDLWFRFARWAGIRHVLTQTKERFDFLFADFRNQPICSILPNSPILEPYERQHSRPEDAVYFGFISAAHGVEQCIEALEFLPDLYRLTLKGPVAEDYRLALTQRYQPLFESRRLTLDSSYVAAADVVPYLSSFGVGFCFYDFNVIAANDFNYLSCPSGKLYGYFAAGIPVIGSDILGLRAVPDRQCGLLLEKPDPQAIARAVLEIASDRDAYRKRCLEAAEYFDFRKHFNLFFAKIDETSNSEAVFEPVSTNRT
jgi:glycosyltransferase involved in cell wall biosynthesis